MKVYLNAMPIYAHNRILLRCNEKLGCNTVLLLNNRTPMTHFGWAFIALCTVEIFFTNPSLAHLTVSIAFFFWEWNILWICICKYSHWRSMFAAFRTCSMRNKQLTLLAAFKSLAAVPLADRFKCHSNRIITMWHWPCWASPCTGTVVPWTTKVNKITVFWDVMQYSLVDSYECCAGTLCLHLPLLLQIWYQQVPLNCW